MTITNRALNRVIARIERQLPEPGSDGLHGQHSITLPAMDWWFLTQSVKELDASWVRLMQRGQTEAASPDLVAALRTTVAAIEATDARYRSNLEEQALREARAALAHAGDHS